MVETAAKKAPPKPVGLSGKEIQAVPYVCGFCNSGFHFRSKRERGPVCKFIYELGLYGVVTCLCDCTKTERDFRTMLSAMGKELPTYSEPAPILPASSLRSAVTVDAGYPEQPATTDTSDDGDPASAEMKFSFGETGRVVKGQLDEAVWRVCNDALAGRIPVPESGITPVLICFEIKLRSGTEYQPSPGAVTAALTRWSKVMWVTVEENPLRLVSMRPDFAERGPAGMKGDAQAVLGRIIRRF